METLYDRYIGLDELSRTWLDDPRWPDRLPIACGFQSFELLLALRRASLDDPRPHVSPAERAGRITDVLCAAMRALGGTLEGDSPPVQYLSPRSIHESRFRDALCDDVAAAFDDAFAGLPYRIGVEPVVQDRPALDYGALVAPPSLPSHTDPSPEDRLFRVVHQVTECWLRLGEAHLHRAHTAARHRGPARRAWRRAVMAMDTASSAIRLLEMMDLSDYHPLRVRLRDGSGAQSAAARRLPRTARRSSAATLTALGRDGLVQTLSSPVKDVAAYQLVREIQAFGRSYQRFLFHHYLLATGVLGSENQGALGYGLDELAGRAARPLFEELDTGLRRLALITDIQHDPHAGTAWQRHPQPEPPLAGHTCSARTHAVIASFFDHLRTGDPGAWAALFDPRRGTYRSSPGNRPFSGTGHLRVYAGNMIRSFRALEYRHSTRCASGGPCRAVWECTAITADGARCLLRGWTDFAVDATGAIRWAVSSWNHEQVAADLLHAH
ncbi:hypothetical protein ACFVH6_32385 [Spirillospora sp. NPDC127200]